MSVSLARPAFRREMPPRPQSPGDLTLEVMGTPPPPSPSPRGAGGDVSEGTRRRRDRAGRGEAEGVGEAEGAVGRCFGIGGGGEAVVSRAGRAVG